MKSSFVDKTLVWLIQSYPHGTSDQSNAVINAIRLTTLLWSQGTASLFWLQFFCIINILPEWGQNVHFADGIFSILLPQIVVFNQLHLQDQRRLQFAVCSELLAPILTSMTPREERVCDSEDAIFVISNVLYDSRNQYFIAEISQSISSNRWRVWTKRLL